MLASTHFYLFFLLTLTLIGCTFAEHSTMLGIHSSGINTALSSFCQSRTTGLYSKECGPALIVCEKDGAEINLLCPFSTWFDQVHQECRSPAEVAECSSVSTLERPSSFARFSHLVIPEDACSNLADGFHSLSPCSLSVFRCVRGKASLFECPSGQAFSPLQGGCADMKIVEECQKVVGDVDLRTQEEQADCSSDGLFEMNPCSSDFLTCFGGVAHVMQCPGQLVFDSSIQACEYALNVADCQTDSSNQCPDGLYEKENCSSTFVACTNNRRLAMSCPSGLVFDGLRRLCDYPQSIPACTEHSSSATRPLNVLGINEPAKSDPVGDLHRVEGNALVEKIQEPDHSLFSTTAVPQESTITDVMASATISSRTVTDQSETESTTVVDKESVDGGETSTRQQDSNSTSLIYDCSIDGLFEISVCSSHFLTCSGGIPRVMQCPVDLIYDSRVKSCEYRENVPGCELNSEDSCEDGLHSFGNCSDSFLACSNNRVVTMYCPSKLAFDESRQLCDYPLAVDECVNGGSGEVGSGIEEASGTEGSGGDMDLGSGSGSVSFSSGNDYEDYGSGSGLAVDYYQSGSGGEGSGADSLLTENSGASGVAEDILFYTEESGSGVPSGEMFYWKEGSGSGVEMETVESSGQQISLIGNGDEEDEFIELSGDNFEKSVVPELSSMCSNRQDGFYALGCSSQLLSCLDQIPFQIDCPHHLVYNEQKGYCDHAENVLECQTMEKEDGLLEYGITVAPTALPFSQTKTDDSLCEMAQDGRRSIGCGVEYVICIAGQAVRARCEDDFTLDEKSGKCVAVSSHLNCTYSEENANGQLRSQDDDSVSSNEDASFPCEEEGAFAEDDCLPSFIHCTSGKGIRLNCDIGYLFSRPEGICLPATDIPECSAENFVQ